MFNRFELAHSFCPITDNRNVSEFVSSFVINSGT